MLNIFLFKNKNGGCNYFLKVPLNTLLERNKNRLKQGKETNAEINERYEKNIDFRPRVKRLIFFDNDRDLIESKKIFLKLFLKFAK